MDLRDASPGAMEETILTEIVANSLDSVATTVQFSTDPSHATLTGVDGGSCMQRRELARYHDLAASTKLRGRGIGFAGVLDEIEAWPVPERHSLTADSANDVELEFRITAQQLENRVPLVEDKDE